MSYVKHPWNTQPPYYPGGFDENNIFGKHCVWAVLPSVGSWYGSPSVRYAGHLRSFGKGRNEGRRYRPHQAASSSGIEITKAHIYSPDHGHGPKGPADTIFFDQTASGVRLYNDTPDTGILFPDLGNLSIIAIYKPRVNGAVPGFDPRIYSSDIGYYLDDHDLMVGSTVTGAVRSRIRLGSTSKNVYADNDAGTDITDDDQWNLVHGAVINNGTNYLAICSHIASSTGVYNRGQSGSSSNAYNPRTTTFEAIGCNAQQVNLFQGWILGMWAFDTAFDDEVLLRKFFRNPHQVWRPREVWIPVSLPTAGAAPFLPFYPKRDNVLLRM